MKHFLNNHIEENLKKIKQLFIDTYGIFFIEIFLSVNSFI